MMSTKLALQLSIEDIVAKRNKVIDDFNKGYELIESSLKLSKEIVTGGAYLGAWYNVKPDEFISEYDRKIWRYIFEVSGLFNLMNADQKKAFEETMLKTVPEINVSTIRSTLITASSEADKTFMEGLVGVLNGVCSNYKSNKAFSIGKKLVFNGVDGYGEWAYSMLNRMVDIERMIHIVNKSEIPTVTVRNAIYNNLGKSEVMNFRFFDVRTFKNGNAHMIIHCQHTIEQLNALIAQYYKDGSLAHSKH